ncbi:MAG: hypothetical protein ABFD69_04180 [Candidatus Sumerlaeia bacterium]
MMNRQRIQEVISLYALLILAVCLQTGCGGYTDPPQEFKASYIITEVSGMGELGTIDEFEKGLSLLKMDNGKTPEIHGWKKDDNVYQLCFSMKDQDCVAQFTFILGGTSVDPKKIGKACTLDYVTAGEGRSEGVGASSVILLAVNALQESGVETSIQKHEKQKKAEEQENLRKLREQNDALDKKNQADAELRAFIDSLSRYVISKKIITQIQEDKSINSKADVVAYIAKNKESIAAARKTNIYIMATIYNGGLSSEYSQVMSKVENNELKTIDDVKAYLTSNNLDEAVSRNEFETFRNNMDSAFMDSASDSVNGERTKALTDLKNAMMQNTVSNMNQVAEFLRSKGIDLTRYNRYLCLKKLASFSEDEQLSDHILKSDFFSRLHADIKAKIANNAFSNANDMEDYYYEKCLDEATK